MSSPPATLNRFDRILAQFLRYLGEAALIVSVWLALVHLPVAPSSGLDPSWRMTLAYALQHGWQFGRDLVFTYGPLGFLLASTNSGGLYGPHLLWQFGANLIFAVSVWLLGRSFTGWRKVVYYVYFFVFGVAYADAVHMIAILLFGLALTRERIVARRWLAALLALALATLALVKFTNLMLTGFAVLSVLGLYVWRRRWLDVAVIGGAFAAAFLGGWVALGQSPANLPAYVVNSLSVSNGYVEAMGLDESGAMFACGLGAALALAGYFGLTLVRPKDFPRALTAGLISAAAVFLNWKHGFVRADGHVLAHFFVGLLFVSAFPVLLQDDGPWRRAKGALLAVCAAFSLTGICLNSPVTILYAASTLNAHLVDTANNLLLLPDLARNARDQFASAKKMFALPSVKALVGRSPVDVFGNEQAYALFNDLNFRPRPALQSYAAYNERLEKLDGDFMASARAPEFVLQKINSNTIDDRLPSMDDALATRYLYHHYSFLMEEQEFLVWKRKAPLAPLDTRTLLSSSTVKFGAGVTTPDLGDNPVWCELDVRPSLLGRLRTFFYKPPVLQLAVTDGGGTLARFRLVRGQAATGFLIYPHFTSNYNVVKFEEGGPGPRIARFAVELPHADQKYYASAIRVRFFKLPVFPRSLPAAGGPPPEVRYRVFNQIPTSVVTPFPPEVMPENGKEVLLAHPPSTLEFTVSPQTHHLTGSFGFISRAYQDGNTTDGAEFWVDWIDAGNRRTTLFHRHLQPLTVPEDRGEQSFKLALPPGAGRIQLRITPGPANNIAFDWTYWTDVKFAP